MFQIVTDGTEQELEQSDVSVALASSDTDPEWKRMYMAFKAELEKVRCW